MKKMKNVLKVSALALLLPVIACSAPADEGVTAAQQTAGPLEPGAEMPADHPPLDQMSGSIVAPVDPGAGTGASGLVWDMPAGWSEEAPANSMRRAQYRVPAVAPDTRDGECVVFYFGPGQGGDPMSNAERWANQFVQPDGASSTDRLETASRSIGDIEVLEVEVSGTYQSGGPMMGGSGEQLPDYMLLGAIAGGADANWFFKFTGPRATVEANRAAFVSMLDSLRAGA